MNRLKKTSLKNKTKLEMQQNISAQNNNSKKMKKNKILNNNNNSIAITSNMKMFITQTIT